MPQGTCHWTTRRHLPGREIRDGIRKRCRLSEYSKSLQERPRPIRNAAAASNWRPILYVCLCIKRFIDYEKICEIGWKLKIVMKLMIRLKWLCAISPQKFMVVLCHVLGVSILFIYNLDLIEWRIRYALRVLSQIKNRDQSIFSKITSVRIKIDPLKKKYKIKWR